VAGDRPLGAAKPVDPATRLSELLAQSLEELTRPFDPPRVDPLMRAPPVATSARPANDPAGPAVHHEPDLAVAPVSRLDDKALAELEAELFAAAASKPANSPASKPPAEPAEPTEEPHAAASEEPHAAAPEEPHDAVVVDPFVDRVEQAPPEEVATPAPLAPELPPAPPADADAERLVARVRRLMLVSMAVTIIAVGSVFGFIGYRVFKGEGSVAKTADKVVPVTPSGNEMTISLPRGARILQSAVAEDRLIITLDVEGRTEVRTYDLKTLAPAGRLTFSTTP